MTRDIADNRITVWKDAYKDGQRLWRAARDGKNYGQVLRGNARPSDQLEDGPLLPPNLQADGWIDVYGTPPKGGYGWHATFEAVEGADVYWKTLSVHEDGPIQEGQWILQVDATVPLGTRVANVFRNAWDSTRAFFGYA